MAGTVDPASHGKDYPAGCFIATRFDIAKCMEKIKPEPEVFVEQKIKTDIFDTVKDAADFLVARARNGKEVYYGELMLKTRAAVFE